MNDDDVIDVTPTVPKTAEELASLRRLTLVTYVLYALAWFNGLTAVIAVIINYVKRDDARGTLYESHFTWQIRTFWWSLAWALVGFITSFILVGFAILFGAAIWSIYRIVKGWLYWNDRKPLPLPVSAA
ncbi:MAG: hypothetical protein RIQ96_1147 [Pseudomonadota bacterium]|jgi:uncharacterized membrane protein